MTLTRRLAISTLTGVLSVVMVVTVELSTNRHGEPDPAIRPTPYPQPSTMRH